MSKLAVHGGSAVAGSVEPAAWPRNTPESERHVLECLRSERWCRILDSARKVETFETAFAEFHDADHGIAVSNGTRALELGLRACGVRPGDEILVPGYSFVATASAALALGAVPRFVDVDPDTYTLDPGALRAAVTDRTVGVLGVHFAGYPMDMDALNPVVDEHDLFLLEDASHAHGSEWRGRKVGALGTAGAFSFQESKTLAGGEGGILLTDDDDLAEYARLLNDFGRRPDRPWYEHEAAISNYRMSELHGALLLGQFEKLPDELERRRSNAARLRERLADVDGIELQPEDDRVTNRGYYFFAFRYDPDAFDGADRATVREAIRAEGVPIGAGYERPLYRQPAFERDRVRSCVPRGTTVPAYSERTLAGVEAVSETLLTLPQQVLLCEPAAMDAIGDAIAKVQRLSHTLERGS